MRTYLHAAVDRACRALLRDGWTDGHKYSAGQNVAQGASHDFVVVTRRGRPVVLAHDAFEAALWMAELETGIRTPHPRRVIRMQSDAEITADRDERIRAGAY